MMTVASSIAALALIAAARGAFASSGSAEESFLNRIRANQIDVYRHQHGGSVPGGWYAILDADILEDGRRYVGGRVDDLYVVLPREQYIRTRHARIVAVSAYPCAFDGQVGRHAIVLTDDGSTRVDWEREEAVARYVEEQGIRIPRPVRLDGTPAPDLGYTVENPRPIRSRASARRPEFTAPEDSPFRRMLEDDPIAFSNMLERLPPDRPEIYSNSMALLRERLSRGTPHSATPAVTAPTATNGGSDEPAGRPSQSPPPPSNNRRAWVIGVAAALVALLAAAARRHRRP